MAPAWLDLHEGGHETAAPRQPSGGSRRGAPVAIRADRLLEGERHRLAPDARIWRIRGLLDRASRALPSCWRGHPLTAPAWLSVVRMQSSRRARHGPQVTVGLRAEQPPRGIAASPSWGPGAAGVEPCG